MKNIAFFFIGILAFIVFYLDRLLLAILPIKLKSLSEWFGDYKAFKNSFIRVIVSYPLLLLFYSLV